MPPISCATLSLNVTFEKQLIKAFKNTLVKVKVKLKFTLEETTKSQKGSGGLDLFSPRPQRYVGWVVNATSRLI
jgi:hypothetical protein